MNQFNTDNKDPRIKHGYAVRTNGMPKRIYRIWCAMIQRCHNPNNWAYKYYGGSGVSVCEEWRQFEVFLKDMEPSYGDGLTIHRIDNSKGYSASNCTWVDRKTQMCHTRRTRNITLNGETKPLYIWADHLGLSRDRVAHRIMD